MTRFQLFLLCATLTLSLACTQRSTAQTETVPTGVTAVKIRQGLLYGHAELGSLVSVPRQIERPVQRYARGRSDDPVDPWISLDKVQHVTFGFLFTLGSQYTLVNKIDRSERASLPVSVGVSAAVGITKEVYDWRRGRQHYFSRRDLVADGIGIGLAALLIFL